MQDRRIIPPLFLLLAALGWSLGGVLIKSVHWHPMALAGARSMIAIPILLLFLGRPKFTWSSAQIGGAIALALTVVLWGHGDLWRLIVLGVVQLALPYVVYSSAIK